MILPWFALGGITVVWKKLLFSRRLLVGKERGTPPPREAAGRYTSARGNNIIISESVFWEVKSLRILNIFPSKPGWHVFCSFTAKNRASPLFVCSLRIVKSEIVLLWRGFRGWWNRSCYFSGLLGEIRKWRMWCFPFNSPTAQKGKVGFENTKYQATPDPQHHITKDVR